MEQEFKNFLLENNCKKAFIDNLEKFGPLQWHRCGNINEFLKKTNEYDYLEDAFLWQNTPEGDDFWNMLNEKWLDSQDLQCISVDEDW